MILICVTQLPRLPTAAHPVEAALSLGFLFLSVRRKSLQDLLDVKKMADQRSQGFVAVGRTTYLYYSTFAATHSEARVKCRELDAHLVEFRNKYEWSEVISYSKMRKEDVFSSIDIFQITAAVPLSRYWIGLSDKHLEGTFQWTNSGTMLSPEVATYWSSNEPNNHNGAEDCVEVWNNHMNDQNCGERLNFVCMYRTQ